jgi:putative chitinase
MLNLDPSQLLLGSLLALLLGLFGQGVRAVAGLRKHSDEAAANRRTMTEVFDRTTFWFSLFIGAMAGLSAYLAMQYATPEGVDWKSGKLVLGIVAAGYAGADFVGGFAKKFLPGSSGG